MPNPDVTFNLTLALPRPPVAGTGRGPLGITGGTDRSYSVDIIVCAVVTTLIAVGFVALRFYARFVVINVLNWEDWAVLGALVFSALMGAGIIHQAILGTGTHVWLVPIEDFSTMARTGWATILFYKLSLFCSQVSILLLYTRIWTFPSVRRVVRWLFVVVLAYSAFVLASTATACIPLRAFWDFEVRMQPGTYCQPMSVWWANVYMHIITDFLIYLLPMPVIYRVRFPTRQKVLLFILFAFGFFICLVSVIRAYVLGLATASPYMDFTFDSTSNSIWSCVETNGSVCVACFMTMKPLLARWFPNLIGGERQEYWAVAGSNADRLPTIGGGNRPMRRLSGVGRRSPLSLTASLA